MLQVENLGFRYRRSRQADLDGVSASFASNAVAVLGPNGAGKSTLFAVLATILKPTTGGFRVDGESAVRGAAMDDYRRSLGVLPQRFTAMPGHSCAEFLAYVAWLRRMPGRQVSTAIAEALELVDLQERHNSKVGTLSGGMRQRLGLAQALVARPRVLLLDEPTVGLDPEQRSHFLTLVRDRVVPSGVFTVMATHLVEDVASFAHEVLLLDAGRAAFAGTIRDFCEAPEESPVSGPLVERGYRRRMNPP